LEVACPSREPEHRALGARTDCGKESNMADHRILIVEDSPTMRQLLAFALKRLKNVEIVEAQDGMDGLRKVTSDHFDLALIDINMPVMDGLKLISLIRGEDSLKEMPICVITTEGATEDRERAMMLGANEYLTKPIQANKVLAVSRSLLKLG
jgi:two-component system chemotaxis response regulator CheY